jgi:formylmethanofuran dehydrogenase subunit E
MSGTLDQAIIDRAVAYHGSLCPGLAVGIQAARLALREVGRAGEENRVVAVAETDICAVDAIQALVGTTMGNRNLVIHDWGKNAFTFFRASDGKSVRIAGRPAWASDYQALRMRVQSGRAAPEEVARFRQANAAEVERILAMAPEELYEVQEVHASPPATSEVDGWTTCAACGEVVMETRARARRGQTLCVPCFEEALAAGPRHRRRPEAMAGV